MKREFKAGEKNYFVILPSAKQERDAQVIYAKAFTTALKSGIQSNVNLRKHLWDEEKEAKLATLQTFLAIGQEQLETKRSGDGSQMKKSQAKILALEMNRKRTELMLLVSETSNLYQYSAEGMADKEKFNYLISVCTKNEDGTKTFSSVDDFNSQEGTELFDSATQNFGMIYSRLDDDYYKNLPENKFLKDYGFVDENYRLIDKDGNLINENGELVKDENPPSFQEFLDE